MAHFRWLTFVTFAPLAGAVPLAFFPSGALYPVESYPGWLRAVSNIDPLTYGLKALRDVLLRGTPASACFAPWVFLAAFTLVCGILTRVLFKREV